MRHKLPEKLKFITPVFLGTGLLISIVAVVLAASVRELPARLETETTTMQSTTRIVSGNGRYVPTRQAGGRRRHAASAFAKSLFEPLESRTLLSGSSALVQELLGDRATLVDEISKAKESARYEQFANPRIHGPLRLLDPKTASLPPKGEKPEDRPKGDDPRDGGAGAGGGESDPLPPRAPSDFRYVLRPGTGWTGATPQPPQQGTGQGANEKAIARWDVVPYQTVDTELNLGVVAFHVNGIDRVEFSVNNGEWVQVSEMRTNPDTGVVEYYATFRADLLSDGATEVRAVAYPTVGVPRVLDSLTVNANADGTLPNLVRYVSPNGNDNNSGLTPQTAVRSPNKAARLIQDAQGGNADGGTVYMLAGSYAISGPSWTEESRTENRWLTLTPAPGVSRAQVTITGATGSAMYNKLVRFKNLTVTGTIESGGPLEDYGWLDGCVMDGGNRNTGYAGLSVAQWSELYMTDSTISNVGISVNSYTFVRDVLVEHVGGDVFSNSQLVINSTIRDFEQAPGAHSDVYQATGMANNVILYGIDASDVGLVNSNLAFEVGCEGMAVVDCKLTSQGPYVMYLSNALRHLYVKDTAFTGNVLVLGTLNATNVVFENTTFTDHPGPLAGVTYR